MAAFSHLHSPPSRDGEELGLSCSGATQLFEVNIICFEINSVLHQQYFKDLTKLLEKVGLLKELWAHRNFLEDGS